MSSFNKLINLYDYLITIYTNVGGHFKSILL